MSEIENTAVLMLGGNVGNTKKIFADAMQMMRNLIGSIEAASSLYVSSPWGMKDQADFLNQAIKLKTNLNHTQLFHQTRKIELDLGKNTSQLNGPRNIDIDILFFNNLIINTNELIIPHPRLHLRRFNLAPVCEIMPDYIHPVLEEDIKTLLQKCPDTLSVNRIQ